MQMITKILIAAVLAAGMAGVAPAAQADALGGVNG
jgi:hypothetical protein